MNGWLLSCSQAYNLYVAAVKGYPLVLEMSKPKHNPDPKQPLTAAYQIAIYSRVWEPWCIVPSAGVYADQFHRTENQMGELELTDAAFMNFFTYDRCLSVSKFMW